MSENWSNIEVELIVADYFNMLADELKGIDINKTNHRKSLLPLLKSRSEGSIEFKHQNISAVLVNLQQPFIRGYKPRFNYQKVLEEKVIKYLKLNPSFERNFEQFADTLVTKKPHINYESFISEAPIPENIFAEKEIMYRPIKINYLEREQNNRLIGELGEEVVIQFEKWRLISEGKASLADKIEWVSKDQGDGLGYDVLSKNVNGSDRYIEVKTTKLSKETPIFFSKNEFEFSKKNSNNYHLYRLYNFVEKPQMFMKNGAFDEFCSVEPIQFKGIF